jgi:F420-dependent oxidoreductase-like protein
VIQPRSGRRGTLLGPSSRRLAAQVRLRIRLGFSLGDYPRPSEGDTGLFDSVLAQVQAAERSGFDSVWVPDHLMQTPVVASRDEPMLECYTLLGALAAATSSVRLGAFVGCAAYRNPALLAKAVTTLDVISKGRAVFGIGAGWFEQEHHAYGYEFGSVSDRFERLVEVIEIVRSMFTAEETRFEGHHYRAEDALNYPRPLQTGGPPILIGGSGEKRTLRLVAEYADICNITGGPAKLTHLNRVLDSHCEAIGRDPTEICRTFINLVIARDSTEEAYEAMPASYREIAQEVSDHLSETVRPIAGTRREVVEQLRRHLDAGIDGMILSCVASDRNAAYVELLGEIAAEAYGSS